MICSASCTLPVYTPDESNTWQSISVPFVARSVVSLHTHLVLVSSRPVVSPAAFLAPFGCCQLRVYIGGTIGVRSFGIDHFTHSRDNLKGLSKAQR